MSLDMTKVIDKLKPIEKRQKDAEAYFRNREKYEKKFMQFDFSIKSKLFDKKTKEGIEEKMVSKTSALIKKLLELDPKVFSQLNQNLGEFTDHTTQTEEDEFQIIMTKVNNLEAENEKLKKKSQKYKKEVGVTNQEVTNLKAYISRLEREGKQAADTIDKLSKDNELLNTKVSDLSAKLNEANDKLAKNEKMTDQYNQMKTLIEERINIENEKHKVQENKETKIKQKYSNHLYGLLYYDLISEVSIFLNSKDIFSLKFSSKALYNYIDEDIPCLKHLLRTVIKEKNREITQNKKTDFRLEYEITDSEIEKLITDYVLNKKVPGRELKSSLLKALAFLNKDVKVPLGIKVSESQPKTINNSTNMSFTQNNQNSGFLSGITSYFYKPGNAQTQSNTGSFSHQENRTASKGNISSSHKGHSPGVMSKIPSGKSSFSNFEYHGGEIDKFDKMLISDNNTYINDISIDFEYNTVEDIKIILNKFLKSNFPTDKLMSFIKEVVCEYSELLYLSNKTLNEIKDLEIVKSAFVERFGKYKKLYSVSDNELKEYKKMNFSRSEIKETSISSNEKCTEQNTDKERVVSELEKVRSNYTQLSENFDKMNVEYHSFKTIFVKELRNLRYDLIEMTKQRNLLRDVLIEFKEYFGKLNINDKGEIMIE